MNEKELGKNNKPGENLEYTEIPEDFLKALEEEDERPLRRRFPAWVIFSVTLLVLVSFLALSLPDFSLYIGKRFDFLSQNALLEDDPLVLAARETVVSITAYSVQGITGNNRSGTGYLISADGKILTNVHVVDGSKKIRVELENGDVYFAGGYKQLQDMDVAVLDINSSDLPYLQVATAALPKTNEAVTVVGNPLGFMRIAARGTIKDYVAVAGQDQVMEINVSTKPGSSGSPVINNEGRAVAIVFAILTREDNQEGETTTLAIPLHLLEKDLN